MNLEAEVNAVLREADGFVANSPVVTVDPHLHIAALRVKTDLLRAILAMEEAEGVKEHWFWTIGGNPNRPVSQISAPYRSYLAFCRKWFL